MHNEAFSPLLNYMLDRNPDYREPYNKYSSSISQYRAKKVTLKEFIDLFYEVYDETFLIRLDINYTKQTYARYTPEPGFQLSSFQVTESEGIPYAVLEKNTVILLVYLSSDDSFKIIYPNECNLLVEGSALNISLTNPDIKLFRELLNDCYSLEFHNLQVSDQDILDLCNELLLLDLSYFPVNKAVLPDIADAYLTIRESPNRKYNLIRSFPSSNIMEFNDELHEILYRDLKGLYWSQIKEDEVSHVSRNITVEELNRKFLKLAPLSYQQRENMSWYEKSLTEPDIQVKFLTNSYSIFRDLQMYNLPYCDGAEYVGTYTSNDNVPYILVKLLEDFAYSVYVAIYWDGESLRAILPAKGNVYNYLYNTPYTGQDYMDGEQLVQDLEDVLGRCSIKLDSNIVAGNEEILKEILASYTNLPNLIKLKSDKNMVIESLNNMLKVDENKIKSF